MTSLAGKRGIKDEMSKRSATAPIATGAAVEPGAQV